LAKAGLVPVPNESPFHGFPGLMMYRPATVYKPIAPGSTLATFGEWTTRTSDVDAFEWVDVGVDGKTGKTDKNVIDLGFTSGHSFYKVEFEVTDLSAPVKLSLDIRNRATLYLNNVVMGGHTTYSLQLLKPGAKNGPDPWPQWTDYVLPQNGVVKGKNCVVIMIESYGLSRQAFCLNDVRNGRGLLGVKLFSGKTATPFHMKSAGVNVATISQPFGVSGFPDEPSTLGLKSVTVEVKNGAAILKSNPTGPSWFLSTFNVTEKSGAVPATLLSTITSKHTSAFTRIPLRLILDGPGTAHVWVGGIYIARYRGNGDSVQKDFVVPDKLVEGGKDIAVKVLVYGWSGEDWVSVRFAGWEGEVEGTGEKRWSGNLVEGGKVFKALKEVVRI
ncbi:hypothetical protein HDU67_002070, partial [Dinochytrium kinnereticum]